MKLRLTAAEANHAVTARERGCPCRVCQRIAERFAKARAAGARLRIEVRGS